MKLARNLLLQLVIGSTTLVVGLSAYWSYRVVRHLILDNLRANAFAEVQNGANEIDRWLSARKAEITVFSSTPTLQTLDWDVVEPYLQQLVDNQSNFFKFGLAYPDGTRYNTTGATREKGSVKDRAYFQAAMAGRLFVTDPIISRSTGIHQVNISSPIHAQQPVRDTERTDHSQESSVMGVFFGSVAVDRVTEIVSRLEYGSGSYPFALNSEGQAITHPNAALMSTKENPGPSFLDSNNPGLAKVAQRMISRYEGIELLELDGHLQYVAFLPLQEADWSIALVIPRDNIERQLLPLNVLAVLMVVLTVGMMIVLWQVQTIEQRALKTNQAELEAQVREKNDALKQLKQTQAQLIHTEKMSGLGQLAAGMAHEINNPLNFIEGNLQHTEEYTQNLLDLISLYQTDETQTGETQTDQERQQWQSKIEHYSQAIDLDFLQDDLPKLIHSMKNGVSRIKAINSSLQLFARVDEEGSKRFDIHNGLNNTLSMLEPRFSESSQIPIQVIQKYGDIPKVKCQINQINQVFLNVLTNAIDALHEKRKMITNLCSESSSDHKLAITIQTEADQHWVSIHITDTGIGIKSDVGDRIFEPFFTTKVVGRGVGLGLSTCHQIIVEQHGGTISYRFLCSMLVREQPGL
ncbi:MAG: histidine kinase [Symploca sp. SIO2B6]|nr:histidine kinase [Symploca sp. SIO2B6]